MLREVFADIVDAVLSACQQVYGPRLRGVVVFGSVARQRMRPDSDIDLLVVAEPLPRGRLARMDEFDAVEELARPALHDARRLGVTAELSPVVRTPDELDQSGFLLYDIAADGHVLFDVDGSIELYLQAIRQRMIDRGTRRVSPTGARYWMVDPNVKPGDVVEL